MMASVCRSCRAPVLWAKTKAGRSLLIDRLPVPNGNIVLGDDGYATVTKDSAPIKYVAHFATCPDAQAWRKRGAK